MTDKLTIQDVRRAGYCVRGARAHCKLIGVDFKQLIRDGIPFAELEPMQDRTVQKSLEEARKRIADGRR